MIAVPAAIVGLSDNQRSGSLPAGPRKIEIAESLINYPLPGEFLARGQPAAAPIEKRAVPAFRITKQQVSLADYNLCVAAGACDAADATPSGEDVPVTGVSFLDAQAYIRWYSRATGEAWRLPTALEAAAAAAERFASDSFSAAADDPANPAVRWLRRYREEASVKRPADPKPKQRGHYGRNSLGVEDFGGNVWEWTSTCYTRTALGADGVVESITDNCGAHVLEGRHRAYISNFVRDGKSGGCAVGTPPENLGFRLVLDSDSMIARARIRLLDVLQFVIGNAARRNLS
ncbi:MAG: formylglycine-generating enzyme family protein [Rhizobiaceae bacterium]|nr:formylglycine-generating enzyme family protein [Rhizobiaceae bacterium]MCV0408982.1 formylglycine-generating enzyme family protein [Rhizobiaceae bacterium]